jgi:DNA repair protein RadA/Sms
MSRSTVGALFECAECGWQASKWSGRCGGCQRWGTVREATRCQPGRPRLAALGGGPVAGGLAAGMPSGRAVPISEVSAGAASARPSGLGELDRVLGGGLVPGAVILLAGEPGVGKSTLLLEAAALVSETGPVLYVTGEESPAQIRLRADRIGAVGRNLYLAAETDLEVVLGHVAVLRPELLIVDSVQTITVAGVEGTPGGVTQIREVTSVLMAAAKRLSLTTVLVGHVTKDGSIAGPRALEHLVDVVLHFDGDRHAQLRMIRALKNRFGPTDEVGCFELGENGLAELPDPSGLFVSQRESPVPGTCLTVTLEGRRPLLAEVQTLVTPATLDLPRRVTSGLDPARVGMMIAVLASRANITLGRQDVYAATVGGVRLPEPAADLAVAIALASASANLSMAEPVVAIGEVGLAGEVRRVPGVARRLAEAARLGFRRAVIPAGTDSFPGRGGPGPGGLAGSPGPASLQPGALEVREAATVRQAVAAALGESSRRPSPQGARGRTPRPAPGPAPGG